MAAAKKKTESVEWDGPEWVLPEDRNTYTAAYEDGELDAAGFGSQAEYEGRSTEMDTITAEPDPAEAKPDPKPGDADYDWTPHYPAAAKLYRHTFPDGTVVAIRELAAIYSKAWLYKIRHLASDAEYEFASIDRASCETAQAVLASVPAPIDEPDPFESLWTEWIAGGTAHAEGEKGLDSGE